MKTLKIIGLVTLIVFILLIFGLFLLRRLSIPFLPVTVPVFNLITSKYVGFFKTSSHVLYFCSGIINDSVLNFIKPNLNS